MHLKNVYVSKNYWIKNQHNRFDNIIKVNNKLSLFTKEIN